MKVNTFVNKKKSHETENGWKNWEKEKLEVKH